MRSEIDPGSWRIHALRDQHPHAQRLKSQDFQRRLLSADRLSLLDALPRHQDRGHLDAGQWLAFIHGLIIEAGQDGDAVDCVDLP